MSCVDLHTHSTASDGTYVPAEVARLARGAGLSGFALTDHDTADGVAEAAAEARAIGIDFIAGIEISCVYPHPGIMHLLGYGIDPASRSLAKLSAGLIEARNTRNPRIVARLRELRMAITMEEVEAEAGGQVIGRPHIAAILVRKGYVSSTKQAFDKYLAPGGLAWFDKERMSPRQAVELVLSAGGIAVLAHPAQLRTGNDAELERIVKDMVDLGVRGIEILHSDHSPEQIETYSRLADRMGLLKTGGSDFHGRNKNDAQLGYAAGRRIPREFMDALSSQSKIKD